MAEETMLGTIVNVEEKGFGEAGYYSLFITDRRLIWGILFGVGKHKIARRLFGVRGDSIAGSAARRGEKKYEGMKPEEILAADEGNFAWEHNDIASIELTHPSVNRRSEMKVKQTSGEERAFDFDSEYFSKAENLLEQIAGDKLKVK